VPQQQLVSAAARERQKEDEFKEVERRLRPTLAYGSALRLHSSRSLGLYTRRGLGCHDRAGRGGAGRGYGTHAVVVPAARNKNTFDDDQRIDSKLLVFWRLALQCIVNSYLAASNGMAPYSIIGYRHRKA
jgi:hypothetical protein